MSRNDLPQPLKEARKITGKADRYRGIVTRVADQLDLGVPHVFRVFRGERRSPKVEAALAWEIERINRELDTKTAA